MRFARWQVAARLIDEPVALPFVSNTKLLTERGMTGATGNWYCGLHEANEMGFVLHALRSDNLFVDIGANVGSYSVIAAGAVGARVIAIEPLPATYAKLRANIVYNGLAERAEALCCGVSNQEGELVFTSGLDTMNRVALPGETLPTTTVPVRTLDQICSGRQPSIIKLDVEGHEAAVLEGGSATLASPSLDAVLMETNGSGKKFGVSDDDLIKVMLGHGFQRCSYDAIRRVLSPAEGEMANSIFVRDPEGVQARCTAAPVFSLINGSI